jgi:hypothetical protein
MSDINKENIIRETVDSLNENKILKLRGVCFSTKEDVLFPSIETGEADEDDLSFVSGKQDLIIYILFNSYYF